MKLFSFFRSNAQNTPIAPTVKETAWFDTSFFASQMEFNSYNPDVLVSKKGPQIYRQMLLDAQVKSAYNLVVNTLISRPYRFQMTEDTEEQLKMVDFLKYNVEVALENTFLQAMKGVMTAKAHGFSISEKVFMTGMYDNKMAWLIKTIKNKSFESFQIEHDQFGNIKRLVQHQEQRKVNLPPEKFIIYVNRPEIDPVWGESDLHAAYRPYWEKDNILKFWNIYIERTAGGFLTATPKDVAVVLSPAEKNDFEKVLRNVSQATAMRVPSGFEVDIKNGVNTDAFEKAVIHRDKQIAKALLVPNLLGFSEQGATGSFAQSQTQLEMFFYTLNYESDLLADTLNEQLFSQLIELNFGKKEFPLFKFDTYTDKQKQEIAGAWNEAIGAGAVKNTFEDELRTRDLLQYPPREKEENDENIDTPDEEEKPPDEEKQRKEEKKEIDNAEYAFQAITTPLERVDFVNIEKKFDIHEDRFFKGLAKNIDDIYADVKTQIRNNPLLKKEEAIAIPVKLKSQMNKTIKENLISGYEFGREQAKRELKHAAKESNDAEVEKKIALMVDCTKRVGIKFDPYRPWCVLDFKDGRLTVEALEKLLPAKSFYITGVISEDILKAARQAILNGIANDKSANAIVLDLTEIISPLVGKVEKNPDGSIKIDPDTGDPIIDTKERARVETIVRTNISDVFNQAQLAVFTSPELGDFVEAFEYSSVLDSRTTPFCEKYDGFTRPVEDPIWEEIRPPNHFNCRSRLIAVTAVDRWNRTKKLPKQDGELLQPGAGFGNV